MYYKINGYMKMKGHIYPDFLFLSFYLSEVIIYFIYIRSRR